MLASLCLRTLWLATASLAATTTIVNPAISSTSSAPSVPTATDIKGNVSFSIINKSLRPPEFPPHVNLTCHNCSTMGTIELAAGGYNSNDSAAHIAMDFFESGFLKFVAHDLGATINASISLSRGFQVANARVPLFREQLFVLSMGDLGDIDIYAEIFMPMTLQLNSEVDINAALTLAVPDNATLYLDFGNSNKSFITGFNESKLTPSFNINAPDLSFSLITGVDFLLSANTSVSEGVDFTADLIASLGLPILNTTVTEMHNVNGTCDVPVPGSSAATFDKAMGVQYNAKVALDLSGGVSVHVSNFSETWSPPAIDAFNHTFALPTDCFRFDEKAGGVIPATATTTTATATTATATAAAPSASGVIGSEKQTNAGASSRREVMLGKASVAGLVIFVLALVVM